MMKIYSTHQVKQIDDYTIKHEPISSVNLMERAAEELFLRCAKIICPTLPVVVYCGAGNNGGDGLAVARMLLESGFNVTVFYLESQTYTADFSVNLNRLRRLGVCSPVAIRSECQLLTLPDGTWIIDALFGSGLNRPLNGLAKHVVNHINSQKKRVVAIDIPSGLFGDENPYPNTNCVVNAAITLTLQFPKRAFFFAENHQYTGSVEVVPIGLHPNALAKCESSFFLVEQPDVASLLVPRQKFSHKGTFGHCLVLAGKRGMMGAASFAVRGCLNAGAGLVTAHIPRVGEAIIQTTIPEAIVSVSNRELEIGSLPDLSRYSAICVGPGIGTSEHAMQMLHSLLESIGSTPLLIDADALNILASHKSLFLYLAGNVVLTPHPGEFDRLFGSSTCGEERLKKGMCWAKELGVVIVIKGANTQVVTPNGEVYFIPVGNAGMATGGSGDVLSGIITAFMGQGLSPANAAIAGAYIHGVAGDIAAMQQGMRSLSASHIVEFISGAFKQVCTI
ncbi:MAG: NAD(P)H-hydrate dehydratase [Bacteroidales bacterium]|nr:NAD(P)H-hydrate dehydratase [Bacteroidales bacterium]MBN2750143.1 NAD(P)H-hydrate dehydratase [Bacteroidales bacterium]